MAVNAIYKQYDGSQWVEYYFKTSVAQVGVSSTRKFVTSSVKVNNVAFTLDSTGDGASLTIGGSNIVGNAVAVSGSSLHYIVANDNISVALGKLDKACKDAYDAIPSGVLTTSNYSTTLNSVYQGLNSNLTSIAALNTNVAGFVKFTNGTASIDTTSYTPTSRTINSKALTGNITLYGTDIVMSSSDSTTLQSAISNVVNIANGKCKAYVTNVTTSPSFNTQNAIVALNGGGFEEGLYLPDLKVGDVVYLTNTNVPDRWVSQITEGTGSSAGTYQVRFSILETTSVDMSWSNITGKPTTISGYGITDCYINNSTGAITIGSVTKTPLYSHQSLASVVPYTGATGDVNLGTHGITANVATFGSVSVGDVLIDYDTANDKLDISNIGGGTIDFTFDHVKWNGNEMATQTWVDSNFARATAGTTAPSNPSSGDIFIDTNN